MNNIQRAGATRAAATTQRVAPASLKGQSVTPANNGGGVPTTPSGTHPALPTPSAVVDDAREKETTMELGEPGGVKEGLGGMLNSAFGCGPDDPGCNG